MREPQCEKRSRLPIVSNGVVSSGRHFAKALGAAIDKPVVDRLTEVAQERELPASQIALGWMLRNPAIAAPIVGATKIAHLDDAIAALSLELSTEEIDRLEEPYQPHPLPPQLT